MGRQFNLLLLVTFTSTFYAKDPETLRIQQKQLKERFETVSKLSNYPQLIYSKSLQSEVQSANLFMSQKCETHITQIMKELNTEIYALNSKYSFVEKVKK